MNPIRLCHSGLHVVETATPFGTRHAYVTQAGEVVYVAYAPQEHPKEASDPCGNAPQRLQRARTTWPVADTPSRRIPVARWRMFVRGLCLLLFVIAAYAVIAERMQ